jgi:amidophosphoribosyltransferase
LCIFWGQFSYHQSHAHPVLSHIPFYLCAMSDFIEHECGLALVRLLQPLDYYLEKYGTAWYGLNVLHVLMQKQINRGQDGAGIGTIKLNVAPGTRYIDRQRSIEEAPVKDIFAQVARQVKSATNGVAITKENVASLKEVTPFLGELLVGHVRYGTHGDYTIEKCHPFHRQNNWMSRNLLVAGNFNMTNVDELVQTLIELGQHPKEKTDTVTVMEKIGHFLDEQNDELFRKYRNEGHNHQTISQLIQSNIDIESILKPSAKRWDGGYLMSGVLGHGDAFVLRDPSGIRPGYYYMDEEIVVVASERPAIQAAIGASFEDIHELDPGRALIIRKNGEISQPEILPAMERKACSFERIYFSRGTDKEIYEERLKMGELLVPAIVEAIDHDFKNTVFGFIPQTAESSYLGMVKGIDAHLINHRILSVKSNPDLPEEEVQELMNLRARVEKVVHKDAKIRTFITQDQDRNAIVSAGYDVTYGILKPKQDRLVILDDSIVRGTTLKQSIFTVLARLEPKAIVLVSAAPQIRYPDCYGINMSRMSEFIAFKAAVELLKESGQESILEEVYHDAKMEMQKLEGEIVNHVKRIYKPFTPEQISTKIAELVRPENFQIPITILFQTLEHLHQASPNHTGDWYFSGDYPTPGGMKVVNRAYVNWFEGNNERSY